MAEKNQGIGGITFTGAITVNGPMFDIHDNENVHIHNGGKSEGDEEEGEESHLVMRLKTMFYGDRAEARAFLQNIRGMKPMQITATVNQLVRDRKISDVSKHRPLWELLHEAGLYVKSESNWNQHVN